MKTRVRKNTEESVLKSLKAVDVTPRRIKSHDIIDFYCHSCDAIGNKDFSEAKRSVQRYGFSYQCPSCLKVKISNRGDSWLNNVRAAAQTPEHKERARQNRKKCLLAKKNNDIKVIHEITNVCNNVEVKEMRTDNVKKPKTVNHSTSHYEELSPAEINNLLFELYGKTLYLHGWLTESSLKRLLFHVFGESNVICNKNLEGVFGRPDFYIPKHKLIVEYDGPHHYTSSEAILRDDKKDQSAESLGIKVLRVPYFIQLDFDTLLQFIGDDDNLGNLSDFYLYYPDGFVHPECVLPADFCEAGIDKFKGDLIRFGDKSVAILNSLLNSVVGSQSMPKSLTYMLNSDSVRDFESDGFDTWKYIFENIITKKVKTFTLLGESLEDSLISNVYQEMSKLDEVIDPNESFFKSYKLLGGSKDRSEYDSWREIFIKLTFSDFVLGRVILGRSSSMTLFTYAVGSPAEADRFFISIDSVHSYT